VEECRPELRFSAESAKTIFPRKSKAGKSATLLGTARSAETLKCRAGSKQWFLV